MSGMNIETPTSMRIAEILADIARRRETHDSRIARIERVNSGAAESVMVMAETAAYSTGKAPDAMPESAKIAAQEAIINCGLSPEKLRYLVVTTNTVALQHGPISKENKEQSLQA